ncbi:MAG: helix-turn-helix domain-containing protein [Defluviitaleaceae bacterium]|nr:helix-turn-helix domain-containing protein [Defluviitaleaceae bacterium]
MPSFSDRLKELRNSRGLTQKQMGAILGCTDRYYQKIEYGKIKFSQDNLIKLADYFDVSIDYLVGRTDNPKRL